MCQCSLQLCYCCSWLKLVRVIIQHTMHGSREERRLDSQMNSTCSAFFCMSFIHLLVWCHDRLYIVLKLQANIREKVDLKEMINYIIHHLEAVLKSTCSQLRPLHNIIRIFIIFGFTEHCQVMKFLISDFSKARNPSQELKVLLQGSSLFRSACRRILHVIYCLGHRSFQQLFRATDFRSSRVLYITRQSAALYDFKYPLTLIKVSSSLTSTVLWKAT